MAIPISALPRRIDKFSKQLKDGANLISRQAATAAGVRATRATRVDTGKARSNWRMSKGSPLSGTIPPYSPGRKKGITERANATAAISQQTNVVRTWNAARGTRLFLTNNVDYIGVLNDGGPGFSPGNMVGMAVQAWRASLSSRRLRKLFR